jgi:hypothetical protein
MLNVVWFQILFNVLGRLLVRLAEGLHPLVNHFNPYENRAGSNLPIHSSDVARLFRTV